MDASQEGALRFQKGRKGLSFWIWVQPNASRDEVCGLNCGALKVKVRAPAVEGRANKALVELLSCFFGVRKAQVEIISGHNGRRKLVCLKGVSLHEISEGLEGICLE